MSPRAPDRAAWLAAPPGPLNSAVFWPFWVGCGAGLRLWFRLRVEGPRPPRGPVVLAANHTSFLDPLVLGAALPRRVTFLMTEVIWRSPVMGWFYRWNHAIPLAQRGGNRDALRAARSVLQQGRVIGIFPEGGISRDGGLLLGSPGAVSLVLGEGVPIVPVGIVGADRALPPDKALPRPRRITVRFGAPIAPGELEALHGDRKGRLQAATTTIMARIAALCERTPREQELLGAAPDDA
ncbi:MAG: lysophospholipid acyltransferase family protein [Planctomycetota bacterium]